MGGCGASRDVRLNQSTFCDSWLAAASLCSQYKAIDARPSRAQPSPGDDGINGQGDRVHVTVRRRNFRKPLHCLFYRWELGIMFCEATSRPIQNCTRHNTTVVSQASTRELLEGQNFPLLFLYFPISLASHAPT